MDVVRRALHSPVAGRRFTAARMIAVGVVSVGIVATAIAEGGGEAASPAFPITIEHKYGTTTITKAPERVVSVGYRDHEHMLALGVAPVAVRDWYGNFPYATWPWAMDALGDAEPSVLAPRELDFERIAALQPDLILGLYSGMTDQEYATLSRIAPTVPQSGAYADWSMPWQEEARVIGRALGRAERAEMLIADIEDRFADARATHPEFDGASAAIVEVENGNQFWLLGPEDHKSRFLTELGFEIPEQISAAVGDQAARLMSAEQLRILELDVVVWLVGGADFEGKDVAITIKDHPLYRQLDVVKEGRDLFLEDAADALRWSTPLSLSFAIDELVPQLAAAVDGDPTTSVEP